MFIELIVVLIFCLFLIRKLDENNNKIGSINSSCKVSFKFKDNDEEEFLCNKECQNVISNPNNEIRNYINEYKMIIYILYYYQ